MANNLNLQQTAYTIELDRINLKQSKNNLLPTINASAGETLGIGRTINPVTDLYQTGTVWATTAGVAFSQNLFNGLQYLNAIKQSELIYKSSKYDLEDAKFNLTVNIINAFLQVLYSSEAIKISQDQVSADSAQLVTTTNMAYYGKKTQGDVLQIKSQLIAASYTLVSATNQWKIAKVNLQQLIYIPVSEAFDIDYNAPADPSQKALEDFSSIYAQSLAFQPIIKSYALKTRSLAYGLRVSKGAYYPQLMLKGNIGTDYSSISKQASSATTTSLENIGYLQSNPSAIVVGNVSQQTTTENNYPFGNQFANNLNGSFSLALSVPVLNYFQVRNNVKKQQVNLRLAMVSEELAKVNLRMTIEQVYANAENATAQYRSANAEVEASKAAYEIAVANFKVGKMIASDLVLQENAYLKALSDNLQAKYALLFNSRILDYYKGGSLTF